MAADAHDNDDGDGGEIRDYSATPWGGMERRLEAERIRSERGDGDDRGSLFAALPGGGSGGSGDGDGGTSGDPPTPRPRPRTRPLSPLTMHPPAVRILPDVTEEPTDHLDVTLPDAVPLDPRVAAIARALGFPVNRAAPLPVVEGTGLGVQGLGMGGMYQRAWADGAAWARRCWPDRVLNLVQLWRLATAAADQAEAKYARDLDGMARHNAHIVWRLAYACGYVGKIYEMQSELLIRFPDPPTSR